MPNIGIEPSLHLPQFKSKVHQPEDSTGGISPIKSLLRDTFFYYLFDVCNGSRTSIVAREMVNPRDLSY
ncbi:hypothetical protein T02_6905 [Trichinella nativa]|uniref:Uncharacterized protein n=1 Tax=Trichinella nativa TaxID=6335 RepID=A0A0V1L2M3_9BILA|nr:hypothetical protein T02_6905 [Trichinella nativa]